MKHNETQEYFNRKCRVTDECPCLVLIHSSFSCINIRVFWGPSVWGGFTYVYIYHPAVLVRFFSRSWEFGCQAWTAWHPRIGAPWVVFQVATSPKNPKDQTLCFKRRNSSFGWSSWSIMKSQSLKQVAFSHQKGRKRKQSNKMMSRCMQRICKEYVCQRARQMPLWSTCHFVRAVWSIDLRGLCKATSVNTETELQRPPFSFHRRHRRWPPSALSSWGSDLEFEPKKCGTSRFHMISHDFMWFHMISRHLGTRPTPRCLMRSPMPWSWVAIAIWLCA